MATKNKDSNRPDGLVSWHTCTTCGKRAYHTKAGAKRSRKHHADPRLGIYRRAQSGSQRRNAKRAASTGM